MKKNNSNDFLIIALVVLGFFVLLGFGFGGMHRDYGMMGSYWTSGFGWMGVFMVLIWILVLAFLVLGIIWLAKQLQKK